MGPASFGDVVNIWSNGDVPGVGLNYGVAVTNRIDVLPVPLPGAASMFAAALLALGMAGYGAQRRKAIAPA